MSNLSHHHRHLPQSSASRRRGCYPFVFHFGLSSTPLCAQEADHHPPRHGLATQMPLSSACRLGRQYQGQHERLGYFFQPVGAELGVKLAGCVLGLPNHPRALALALDCPATDGQALSCSGAQHQPSHGGHESARTDHVRQSLRFLVSISNSPRVRDSHLILHPPQPYSVPCCLFLSLSNSLYNVFIIRTIRH